MAAGNSNRIQGLYAADKAFIIPSIGEPDYVPILLEICQRHEVAALFSMTAEDVYAISQAAEDFRKLGVFLIIVDHMIAATCNNKIRFHEFLVTNGFPCAKTCLSFEEFKVTYQNNEIDFPVLVKPIYGYSSQVIRACNNMNELRNSVLRNPQCIIQEFLGGSVYSIDVYIDFISGKMVSAFITQRIIARTGVSDKAISVLDDEIFAMTEQISYKLGALGALNVNIFKANGTYYYNEVNPCLGNSYILAHSCGVDFGKLMVNNLNGIENAAAVGHYQAGVLMMNYDEILLVPPGEIL